MNNRESSWSSGRLARGSYYYYPRNFNVKGILGFTMLQENGYSIEVTGTRHL